MDDYEQGIKAGMKPAFDNPADALMARYQAGERYLSALGIRDGIDKLGMLRKVGADERLPLGFAHVNDSTFAGHVVPELVARDLNNYLAPGLNQFKAWRGFRWLQNAMLSVRLGFSAFHLGFTTTDSAIMHLDLAMRYAAMGDVGTSVKQLGKFATAPLKALRLLGEGLQGTLTNSGGESKLLRQFLGKESIDDPNTAALIHALTEGGARARFDPTDYNNDFGKTLRAWRTDGVQGLAKTPLRSLGAVIEGVMRPISHYVVPEQKMVARMESMKYELDRVAKQLGKEKGDYDAIVKAMNPDALRQIAHNVVQRIDDRLGQLAYDNLFWHRTVKDIAQASIQSVGWQLGTYNVILGGLKDARRVFNPEKLLAPLDREGKITNAQMSRVTGRLSYLIALNLGIGTLGAVTQYMLTGKGPEELRDYFFPKTGATNPDGTDARISFPSYVKDQFAFAKHPILTAEHKLHPVFSMVSELLNDKDFYGNRIYNKDDPWTKVAEQVGSYILSSSKPYAVQNQQQIAKQGGSVAARIAPFFGITPAPGDIVKSPFQTYVSDSYFESHPSASRTPEEAAARQKLKDASAAIQRGEKPDLSGFTMKERASIQRMSKSKDYVALDFGKLSLQQQLAAYEKATEEERTKYKLRQKILSGSAKALQKESDADLRETLRRRVDEIRKASQ